MPPDSIEFTGEDVQRIRNKLGMTIIAFAQHIGTYPSTVSRWENGHREVSPAYVKMLTQEESYLDKTTKRKERLASKV